MIRSHRIEERGFRCRTGTRLLALGTARKEQIDHVEVALGRRSPECGLVVCVGQLVADRLLRGPALVRVDEPGLLGKERAYFFDPSGADGEEEPDLAGQRGAAEFANQIRIHLELLSQAHARRMQALLDGRQAQAQIRGDLVGRSPPEMEEAERLGLIRGQARERRLDPLPEAGPAELRIDLTGPRAGKPRGGLFRGVDPGPAPVSIGMLDDDPAQPRAEGRGLPELVEQLERVQERLLDDVAGQIGVVRAGSGDGQGHRFETDHQRLEGAEVPGARGRHDLGERCSRRFDVTHTEKDPSAPGKDTDGPGNAA